MYWGNHVWGMGFGWIFMFIFWILVILGIVFLVKMIIGSGKTKGAEDSALDILKKRYASGEITREEFEKIKDDISRQ